MLSNKKMEITKFIQGNENINKIFIIQTLNNLMLSYTKGLWNQHVPLKCLEQKHFSLIDGDNSHT